MRYLRFGSFIFDAYLRKLTSGSSIVDLQHKPLELLGYLIENRDRVVSREELVATVWGGTRVSEAAIASALRDLRRALGDTGRAGRFVETRRGHGVRFVADVVESRTPEPELYSRLLRRPLLSGLG